LLTRRSGVLHHEPRHVRTYICMIIHREGKSCEHVRCAVEWMITGRFRYIAWVKYPYRVAGKASALRAGKWASG